MLIIIQTSIKPDLIALQFEGGGMEFFETLKSFKLSVPASQREYWVKDRVWIVKNDPSLIAWYREVQTNLAGEFDVIFDEPQGEAEFIESLSTGSFQILMSFAEILAQRANA